jgi:toxin YoeB
MKLVFADGAWEDDRSRQKPYRKMVERIDNLTREVRREPFSGLGKPDPLKHALSGFWSRVEGDELQIAQLRFHHRGA